jgi:hypothetical protein
MRGVTQSNTEVNGQSLVAYRRFPSSQMRLAPAPSYRPWMTMTREHFANRCLPLLIANQAGWMILNSRALRATWSGGNEPSSLKIEFLDGSASYPAAPYPAISHFGHGILTWNIPYLFRTPPGYNLLVRGPANWPKDGIHPLEGVVEADWAVATFTMNWKFTRSNLPVTFSVDEPLCMIVPQRRGELEEFWPQTRDIQEDAEVYEDYKQWRQGRERFLSELRSPTSAAARRGWQRHYFQGITPAGFHASEHQLKLNLRDFDESFR